MSNYDNEDRPSFVVQNITLNYHFVSDIGYQFAPKEVKDLTWEDPLLIKKSKNLADSLKSGILRKLSEEEYEKTLNLQHERQRKELMREQQEQQNTYKKTKIDDKEFVADRFDVSKARKAVKENTESMGANHPLAFVAAFEAAQSISADRGEVLTAEEFAQIVESNPEVVPKLLASSKREAQEKIVSNVYFAAPPEFGGKTSVYKSKMTNYNRALMETDEGLSVKSDFILDAVKGIDVDMNTNDFDDNSEFLGDEGESFAEHIEVEE